MPQSEQLPQVRRGHADDCQDIPQRTFGHIAARMNGDDDVTTVGMAHDVVAPADPRHGEPCPSERLHHLVAGVPPGRAQASGDIEGQRQLIRRANLCKQDHQRIS
jgi:hypothetical protein